MLGLVHLFTFALALFRDNNKPYEGVDMRDDEYHYDKHTCEINIARQHEQKKLLNTLLHENLDNQSKLRLIDQNNHLFDGDVHSMHFQDLMHEWHNVL